MNAMAEFFTMDHQSHQIFGDDKVKMVINTLPPNGGSGTFSYSKNSYFQVHTSKVTKFLGDSKFLKLEELWNILSTDLTLFSRFICVCVFILKS